MLFKTRNIFLDAIAVIFTITLVMSLALGIALSQGPVSLRYITPIINVILAQSLALDDVNAADMKLVYDRDKSGLHLQGTTLSLKDGAAHYLINDFSASISTKGLFRSFVFVPETLTAKDIIAVITPAGRGSNIEPLPSPSLPDPENSSASPIKRDTAFNPSIYLREIRDGLSETAQLNAISYVQRIDFPNITFVFEDAATGKVWKTSESYALFSRDGSASHLNFNFAFNSGAEKSAVNFELQQPEALSGSAKLKIKNIRPSVIASLFPTTPFLKVADVPLEGEVNFTTSPEGAFSKGRMALQLSGGTLRLQDRLLPVDHAVVEAEINFENRQAVVDRIDYAIGPHEGYFTGTFNYDFDANGIASNLNAALKAQKLLFQFSEDEVFNPDKLSIDFHLDLFNEKLDLQKIAFETGGGVFQIGGNLDFGNPEIPLNVDGFIERLPIEGVKKIWPSGLVPKARKWFVQNINEGVITNGTLKMETSAAELRSSRREKFLRNEAVDLQVELEGSSLRYISKMPEMQNVKASFHLRGNSFEVLVHQALIDLPEKDQIILSNSRYFEPDFNIRGNNVNIRLVLDGQVDTLINLFARPQIGFKQANFIGDYKFEGQGRMALSLAMPVSSKVSREDRRKMMELSLDAVVRDFNVPGGVNGYDVKAPFISFTYRGEKLGVESDIIVNGVPIEVSLTEEFVNLRRHLSKVSIQANLTEYDLANLKADSIAKRMRGRLPVNFDLIRDSQGHLDINFKANMEAAAVKLFPLAYEKEVGRRADLNITATMSNTRQFENVKMVMRETDTLFEATATFKENRLETLFIPSLSLNNKGSVEILLDRSADKRLFTLTGSYFDMSKFVESTDFGMPSFNPANPAYVPTEAVHAGTTARDGTEAATFDQGLRGDMDIEIDVTRLQGNNGVYLKDFTVDAYLRDDIFEQAVISGDIISGNSENANPLLFNLSRETSSKRVYNMHLPQADTLFKALGTLENMQDGELVLSGQLTNDPGKGEGTLYISDFTVPEIPTLAKIISLGSLKGISDTIQNEGLSINTAELEFRHKGQLLEVKSFIANGPALGITMEGIIDRGEGVLFLDGTLVPAYSLNSLFGRIPIIGFLFSGGQGGGLLGLSYDISGPINKPEISVNPLSLFTPGFIRNIFSVRIFGPSKPKIEY